MSRESTSQRDIRPKGGVRRWTEGTPLLGYPKVYPQLIRSAKMSVLTKLQEDMKTAMKSGQKERLGVIRMLISDVKNIDLAPKKITEEEAVAAYGKKLKKSIEEYEKLGKPAQSEQLKKE